MQSEVEEEEQILKDIEVKSESISQELNTIYLHFSGEASIGRKGFIPE